MLQNTINDKTYLITGASSGIGQCVAYKLKEQGCRLVLTGRNKDPLELMKKNMLGQAEYIPFDLADLDHIEYIFEFCREKGFKLDGMVHSAGIAKNAIIRANDWRDFEEVMRVNCLSFVELGKYFGLKKYSNEGASIVAISSIASQLHDTGMTQYSASKAALNSTVKTMAKEFLKRKIRVNAVLPANVNTNMFLSGQDYIEDFMENALTRQPLGIVDVEQVAYLIEFLLSDNAKYITGEWITIGGGMSY